MIHLLEAAVPLFFIQLFCTYAMTGIIWFVQIVHYPLFNLVGQEKWTKYHRSHSFLITWIVAPLMLLELAAAIYYFFLPLGIMLPIEKNLGALLAIIIWISTFALQVPQHNRLAKAFLSDSHRRLVATNWIRTICWSARSVIITIWLYRAAIHSAT